MQAQIQVLIARAAVVKGFNTGSNIEVAKLPVFNGEAGRVGGFIIACRLYLRIRMRGATMEEQIQ